MKCQICLCVLFLALGEGKGETQEADDNGERTELEDEKSCRELSMDVLFVVDGSTRINRQHMENLLEAYCNEGETTFHRIRFAAIHVNKDSCQTVANFSEFRTKSALLEILIKFFVKWERPYTETNCMVFDKSLLVHQGGRSQVTKATVIITENLNMFLSSSDKKMFGENFTELNSMENKRVLSLIHLDGREPSYPWSAIPRLMIAESFDPVALAYTLCFRCPDGWLELKDAYPRYTDQREGIKSSACYRFGFSAIQCSSNMARDLCEGRLASFEVENEWSRVYELFQNHLNESTDILFERAVRSTIATTGREGNRDVVSKEVVRNYINATQQFLPLEKLVTGDFPDFLNQAIDAAQNDTSDDFADSIIRHFYSLFNQNHQSVGLHIGLRRQKELWGGWDLIWDTGTPLLLRRNGVKLDWTNSKLCVMGTFSQCIDNTAGTLACAGIEEKPVPCWEKHNHYRHYVCEYPRQYAYEEQVMGPFVYDTDELTKYANLRKCYLENDRFIWVPVVRQHPGYLKCVKEEYFINNRIQRREEVTAHLPVFNCKDHSQTVVGYESVCDYFIDCHNAEDERCTEDQYGSGSHSLIAFFRKCTMQEFECDNKQCIMKWQKCDRKKHCSDGSDEADCSDVCLFHTCPTGECIPFFLVGDGYSDCRNGGDEIYWHKSEITQFRYARHLGGVNGTAINCTLMGKTGLQGQHQGPKCVYARGRYGVVLGCRNYEHLSDCENFECPEGTYKCQGNSFCIPFAYLHDDTRDCPLGDDEAIRLWFSAFSCTRKDAKTKFLHPSLVCDGHIDCVDAMDEQDCKASACHPGFICAAGGVIGHDLENIQMEDLTFLGELDYLKFIQLSNIHLTDTLDSLFNMEYFDSILNLSFINCRIASLVTDSKWSKRLNNFRLVKHLQLSYNKIRADLTYGSGYTYTYLDVMSNLNMLNLSNNPNIVCSSAFLRRKNYLKTLDLSYTGITGRCDEGLDSLPSLRKLYLNHCPLLILSGTLFSPSLGSIHLGGIPVSTKLSENTFGHIANLKTLMVSNELVCCPIVLGEGIDSKACIHHGEEGFIVASCEELFSVSFLPMLVTLVMLLSLGVNIASFAFKLLYDESSLSKTYGYIVLHLNFSDFLMALYLLILTLKCYTTSGYFALHSYEWRKSFWCHFAGFVVTVSIESNVMFVSLITFERYMSIHFTTYTFTLNMYRTKVLCGCAWALSIFVSSIPFWPRTKEWVLFSRSSVCNALPLYNSHDTEYFYSSFLFSGFNSIMFLLISGGQVATFISFRNHTQHFHRKLTQTTINVKQHIKVEQKVAQRLGLVVLASFALWFPVVLMNLYTATGGTLEAPVRAFVTVLMLPIPSVLDPVLYTLPKALDDIRQAKEQNRLTAQLSRSRVLSMHKPSTSMECSAMTLRRAALYLNGNSDPADIYRINRELLTIMQALQQASLRDESMRRRIVTQAGLE